MLVQLRLSTFREALTQEGDTILCEAGFTP